MSKRYARLLKSQTKVKVIAQSYNDQQDKWILLAAAGAACIVYFFSFFFSFTGGCVPAGN